MEGQPDPQETLVALLECTHNNRIGQAREGATEVHNGVQYHAKKKGGGGGGGGKQLQNFLLPPSPPPPPHLPKEYEKKN